MITRVVLMALLFFVVAGTRATETTPPSVASVNPPPGELSSLTQVTVTFSEPVTGVSADDFLINTQPANAVSGNGNAYTFSFAQPFYGNVSITWFAGHGIADQATPPNLFDATGPGATWEYTLLDQISPTVVTLFPSAGATVRSLSQVEVGFSEEITGLEAGDLLVNGQAAISLTRASGGPYVFQFPAPLAGSVQLQWAAGHGITDQAAPPNAFAATGWSYQLDPNAPLGDLVITEILAANQSGLLDEDGQEQDWIEIYNRGSGPVNLADWSLSDDPEVPGLWTFPSRSLAAGQYLVVFASGKDRKPVSGANRLHTNFQLGKAGEHLGLYTPDSPRSLTSGFDSYPEQQNDNSYGFDNSGNLRYFATLTPGMPNGTSTIVAVAEPVHFSVERGLFTAPFTLTLSSPTPGALIRYTTDGSEPTPFSGLYVQGIQVNRTTLVRAAAFKSNFLPSRVITHSYLFNLTAAQRSLPIINLVTATNNLIGRTGILGMGGGSRAGDGLYITNNPATDFHNPSAHGIAWERPVSAEYIRPEDNSGFQIDCGLRVMGSDWQRPRTTPTSKFSFRLYFRGDYGPDRLEFPLFPLTSVQRFDQVVLRAGFNEQSNPFIRDEITRRLSHDMGQVAAVGGLALVLLNGGQYTNNASLTPVYNPCERVHEEMLQSHLGGGPEWDVVGPSFAISSEGLGIVDGDRNDFNNLINYVWNQQTSTTITNPAVYNQVARRLDLVNFVDYCLLNAYTAMGDWPANNWRAARERSTNGIWRFIVWDAEWAMGIYSLAVTRDSFAFTGSGTEDAGLNSTGNSEIARLYQRLRPSREFRLLWADRIHKHFFNRGALTGLHITNRFNDLRDQLRGFIPTMDTEILQWVRDRHNIVMGQFNTYGLYGYSNALYGIFASSNAPMFSQHGGRVVPGFSLSITSPLPGTIYYTLNGHDPRVPFSGAVSNAAVAYTGAVTLDQTVVVKARTLHNGTNWSALTEAAFEIASLGVPLRITEILYNPTNGSSFEFIELQNVGSTAVDLSGIYFDGINFVFSEGSTLAAGARLVLGSNTDTNAWQARYPGVAVAGWYGGNLNNAGERITLFDRQDNIITSLDYDDENGWATAPDGPFGYSLEVIDTMGDPDDPANWRASGQVNGTPGATGTTPLLGDVRLNEVLADNLASVNHSGTYPDWVELHNAGAAAVNISGWSLTDDGNPRKFVFPANTTIAASGYLVVWCDPVTNATPGLHTGFSLDNDGEGVFLYNAETNLQDAITFGPQVTDHSVGRIHDDWTLTMPTPNAVNMAATLGSTANLAINEWMANPVPGESDWIELFNHSMTEPVSLRGIYLGTTGIVHRVNSLSFIAPNGYVQLFADEGVGPDHLDFRLSGSGGGIVLYDEAASEIQRVLYGGQSSGVSQGRLPDGNTNVVSFPGSVSARAMNYTATYAGAVLNEVLARNESVSLGGSTADFIEIHNPTPANFDLGGMSMSVNQPAAGLWVFPPNTVLAPNGFLVLPCDGLRPASTNAESFNLGEPLDGESGGAYLFNGAGQLVSSVEYGFQIENASIGLSDGQWRLLTTPTPGAANAPARMLATNTMLRLNEWMANPGEGADWFEIYNPTNQPVDLGSTSLTDDPSTFGRGQHPVAPLSFIPAGGFVKWTADADASQGRNHVNFALNAGGDSLLIYSVSGTNFVLIDAVAFGAQAVGVSEGRLLDGAPNIVAFPESPTPGASNYRLLQGAVINELLTHTDLPLEDAIELHNPTAFPANIGGWYLSNTRENYRKYRIPDETVIAPGGYAVFYEYQFNDGSANGFDLSSAHGDEVWLSVADAAGNPTGERAGAKVGAAENGVSFGRVVTSVGVDYAATIQRTFDPDPNPGSVAEFRAGTGLANSPPLVGPVVINEAMYHPAEGTNFTADDEYIELHNSSASVLLLYDPAYPTNTWRVAGGVEFAFPPGVSFPANGFLLLVPFDPANAALLASFRAKYGVPSTVAVYGPYAGKLDNAGESIELLKPDAPQPPATPEAGFVPYVLTDKVDYRDAAPWPAGAVDGGGFSLQRGGAELYGNEPIHWFASAPTPGAANGAGIIAPPAITLSPQSQSALVDATITFNVQASSAAPLQFQWRFNGKGLPEATNAALVIPYVQLENTGLYDVIVSNPGGSDVSDLASLVINAPPFVLLGPVSQVATGGLNVTLSVQATGTQPLLYQWGLNGVSIPGANESSVLLTNVGLDDIGEYSVRVSNQFGAVTTNANLLVLVPPAITQQPEPQIAPEGGTAVFSVSAIGTLPMGFRWRRSGATVAYYILNQNTSVYYVTNAPAGTPVNYTVVVTNAANRTGVLSIGARLTVVPDTDGDGLPDDWEIANGLNQNDPADGNADPDGDTLTNLEEYIAGTIHTNAQSYLKVDRVTTTGSAVVSFNAVSNRTYSVLYADSVTNAVWSKLVDVPARATTELQTVTDSETGPNRFYRLVTPAQR